MSKKDDVRKMLDIAMKLSPEGVKYILSHMETYMFAQEVEKERQRSAKGSPRRIK